MRTKIFNGIKVLSLALILSAGVSYLYAWTGPTAVPPAGNAAAPLNISSTAQTKIGLLSTGNMGVGGVAANNFYGLSVGAGSMTAITAVNSGPGGMAIYGNAAGNSVGRGVVGSGGTSGVGVSGDSPYIGVSGYSNGVGGMGVHGVTDNSSSYGVYGEATYGGSTAVYGKGPVGGYDFLGFGGEHAQSGSWTNSSDRNKKENFVAVDKQAVLKKIIALPMTQWNYKTDKKTVHLGPIAQDFYALFGLGENNTTISTIDPAGVALVGVKALNEKIDAQQKEIDELKAAIKELKK